MTSVADCPAGDIIGSASDGEHIPSPIFVGSVAPGENGMPGSAIERHRTGAVNRSGILPDGPPEIRYWRLGGIRPHAGHAVEPFFIDGCDLISGKGPAKDRHFVDLAVEKLGVAVAASDGKRGRAAVYSATVGQGVASDAPSR